MMFISRFKSWKGRALASDSLGYLKARGGHDKEARGRIRRGYGGIG